MEKCSNVNKIAHVLNWRHDVKRQESTWVFNVPNYPVRLTRKDACFSRTEATMSTRQEKLIENLEANNQNKKRGVKMFNFDQLWKIQNKLKALELKHSPLKKRTKSSNKIRS